MKKRGFIENGAAMMALHKLEDWCHLCGLRSSPLVDVWYPKNAEHGGETDKYIRICDYCLSYMKVLTKDS